MATFLIRPSFQRVFLVALLFFSELATPCLLHFLLVVSHESTTQSFLFQMLRVCRRGQSPNLFALLLFHCKQQPPLSMRGGQSNHHTCHHGTQLKLNFLAKRTAWKNASSYCKSKSFCTERFKTGKKEGLDWYELLRKNPVFYHQKPVLSQNRFRMKLHSY